jgi:hypothetical protein
LAVAWRSPRVADSPGARFGLNASHDVPGPPARASEVLG